MSETALVTGAGGFIGSHLVKRLLERDHSVIAVDVDLRRLERLHEHPLLRAVELDLRNHEAVAELAAGVDTVFHLAAAHLEVGAGETYFRAVNVGALENLLRAAGRSGVRRFVHCSTVGVYGPLETLPADENTPCRPEIAYETTKLEGEAAVRDAVSGLGLGAVILRPSWVYGPECPRTLKLLRAVVGRRFFFVGGGTNLRHPLYISDLLRAFELAATVPVTPGQTFIVAGPKAVTTRELVETIIALTGARYRPPTLPLAPVTFACRLLEWAFTTVNRDPPFSTRSLKFFTESSSFSIAKARQVLGFEPLVSLEEGLSGTIAYAREHGLI